MYSSYEIEVYGIRVCLDFVLKLVDRFEGGFATNFSEARLIEEGVFVIDSTRHGRWKR